MCQELARAYTPANNAVCGDMARRANERSHCPTATPRWPPMRSGASLDSRAISLAQVGRYTEAATDLRADLAWVSAVYPAIYAKYRGRRRKAGSQQIERGENPFTPELLEQCKG